MKKTRLLFSTIFLGALFLMIGIAGVPNHCYAAEGDIDSGIYDNVPWRITSDYELLIGEEGEEYTFTDRESRSSVSYPWKAYSSQITEIQILGEVNGSGSLSGIFNTFTNCTSIDLTGLNTSNVTNMDQMFRYCDSLQTLDLSGFETDSVSSMTEMFRHCIKLKTLELNSFNTSNVTSTNQMFYDCADLQTLDLSGFDTENVTDMQFMFRGCNNLESLNIRGFDTTRVENMSYMFHACWELSELDLSGLNARNVTNMNHMFSGCSDLQTLDLSGFRTHSVTDMAGMFYGCNGLQTLDLSGFDTSNAQNMSEMFAYCERLQTLDLSGFDTSSVTGAGMSGMFSYCRKIETLNLSGLNTSSITNTSYMFNGCTSLMRLDLSGLDFSGVTNMECMFGSTATGDCSSFYKFITPNWSNSTATFPTFPVKMRNAVTKEEYEAGTMIPAEDGVAFEVPEIIIEANEEKTASKKLFEEITDTDIDLIVQDNDIQWTFDGRDVIPENCKDIDLTTYIHKENGESVGFADDSQVLVIDFADNGQLPGEAEIQVVNDYISSQKTSGTQQLMLSYVDGDQINLEDDSVQIEGSDTAVFKIDHNSRFILSAHKAAKSIKSAKVIVSNCIYSGKLQKPSVTVKLDGKKLDQKYYSAPQFSANKAVGTASVKVQGNSDFGYTGTASGSFYINPKKAAISKVKAGKKKITVTMKTNPSATGGNMYKIEYRVAGKGNWKSTTTSGKTKTIKKLKKGKKYQVRVTAVKGSRKGAVSAIKKTTKVK